MRGGLRGGWIMRWDFLPGFLLLLPLPAQQMLGVLKYSLSPLFTKGQLFTRLKKRPNELLLRQRISRKFPHRPQKYARHRAGPSRREIQLSADSRCPGELLAHIALSHNFQYQIHATERRTTLVGFDFPSIMKRRAAEEKEPRTKDQILDMLRTCGEKWDAFLQGLTEDFLAEQVQMPPGITPPSKSRFEMILSVKEHEMHHRGQLMLIERLLGVVPHLTREMQSRLAG